MVGIAAGWAGQRSRYGIAGTDIGSCWLPIQGSAMEGGSIGGVLEGSKLSLSQRER